MQTVTGRHGVFTIDDVHDPWLHKNLVKHGSYQNDDLEAICPLVTGNVVDVGGHVGIFTIPLAKRARHVWAVEGNPKTFALLQQNIAANKCTNVTALNMVAAAEKGEFEMVDLTHDAEIRFVPGAGQPGTTLDAMVAEPVSFIKIDAEGMEPDVLRGATRIIREDKPFILFEVSSEALGGQGRTREAIVAALPGYTFYRVDDGFNRLWSLSQGLFYNALAVPPGKQVPVARGRVAYLFRQLLRRIRFVLGA